MIRRPLIRMGPGLMLALALTGCATIGGGGVPTCDGGHRRPLNRSMWDWEKRLQGQAASAPAAPSGDPAPGSSVARAPVTAGAAGARAQRTGTAPSLLADASPVAPAPSRSVTIDVEASIRACGGVGATSHG